MTQLQYDLAEIIQAQFPNQVCDEKGLPIDMTNEEFRKLFSSKEYENWMLQCPPAIEPKMINYP